MPIDFTRPFYWRNRGKLDVPNDEAWQPSRLLPLLAGLVELEPWLHQWYAGPEPDAVLHLLHRHRTRRAR